MSREERIIKEIVDSEIEYLIEDHKNFFLVSLNDVIETFKGKTEIFEKLEKMDLSELEKEYESRFGQTFGE